MIPRRGCRGPSTPRSRGVPRPLAKPRSALARQRCGRSSLASLQRGAAARRGSRRRRRRVASGANYTAIRPRVTHARRKDTAALALCAVAVVVAQRGALLDAVVAAPQHGAAVAAGGGRDLLGRR